MNLIRGSCGSQADCAGGGRSAPWPGLEIAFLLFLFHGCVLVVIDKAALALGGGGGQSFLHALGDRCGAAFHSGGERIAAGGAETDTTNLGRFSGAKRKTVVVDHDPL